MLKTLNSGTNGEIYIRIKKNEQKGMIFFASLLINFRFTKIFINFF